MNLAIGASGFRWLDRALLGHPFATALVAGVAAGAFAMTDMPIDWGFVIVLAVVVAAALLLSSAVLRRRARRYLSDTEGNR